MLLQSVTHNGQKLAQAALVIILVVYFYAVLGFVAFYSDHDDGKCLTLLNCLMSYLAGGISGEDYNRTPQLQIRSKPCANAEP